MSCRGPELQVLFYALNGFQGFSVSGSGLAWPSARVSALAAATEVAPGLWGQALRC